MVKNAMLQLSKKCLTAIMERTMIIEMPRKVRELAEILDTKPELSHKNVLSYGSKRFNYSM